MRAVILAAGMGTRLKELTRSVPKAMVPFMGRPLIHWQVEALRLAGVDDITVVTGYKQDSIRVPGIRKVHNENFATTNMVESLMCAREILGDGFLLAYSDIVYDAELVRKMVSSFEDIAVAGDTAWRQYWQARFPDDWEQDLESFTADTEGVITDIGRPVENAQGITHRYVGLIRFSSLGAHELLAMYDRKKKLNENWAQSGKTFEQGYMTDILCELAGSNASPAVVEIENGWLEFDEPEDVRVGEALFASADRKDGFGVKLPNLEM